MRAKEREKIQEAIKLLSIRKSDDALKILCDLTKQEPPKTILPKVDLPSDNPVRLFVESAVEDGMTLEEIRKNLPLKYQEDFQKYLV